MRAHTPGPWRDDGGTILTDERTVAQVDLTAPITHALQLIDTTAEQLRADARLIAAAPDLLDALRVLVQRVEQYAPSMDREGDLIEAKAALRKAGGES